MSYLLESTTPIAWIIAGAVSAVGVLAVFRLATKSNPSPSNASTDAQFSVQDKVLVQLTLAAATARDIDVLAADSAVALTGIADNVACRVLLTNGDNKPTDARWGKTTSDAADISMPIPSTLVSTPPGAITLRLPGTANDVSIRCLLQTAVGLIGTAADRIALQQARHTAHVTDPLTGLAGEQEFVRSVGALLDVTGSASCAMVAIELTALGDIDHSLGFEVADEVLICVASRLRLEMGPGCTAGRVGPHLMAVAIPYVSDAAQATVEARRIWGLCNQLVRGSHGAVGAAAIVGVAVSLPGEDPVHLLRRATSTLIRACESGDQLALHENRDDAVEQTAELFTDLSAAIARSDIDVFLQPVVDLSDNRVTGFEALARWIHPVNGMIPCDRFITLAEKTGLIGPLTLVVLDRVVNAVSDWSRRGAVPPIAVNLSVKALSDPSVVTAIRDAANQLSLMGSGLIIEVTESVAQSPWARDRLWELRPSLAGVMLDDFGTGYSSLTSLKVLPLTAIKLDQAYSVDLGTSPKQQAVVRAVTTMGHTFGFAVVLEGVETQDALLAARELGCDAAQGYVIARPAPFDVAEEWLHHRQLFTV